MAMKKAKEIVSSNAVVVFRSVSSRLVFFTLDSCMVVCEGFDRVYVPMERYYNYHTWMYQRESFFVFWWVLYFCSKSYCPYCVKVKDLLKKLGAKFIAVELDKESNNSQSSSHNHFNVYDLKIEGFSAFTVSRNFVIVFFSSILCFIQLYAFSGVSCLVIDSNPSIYIYLKCLSAFSYSLSFFFWFDPSAHEPIIHNFLSFL